jgi:uncharacterized membrane protein YidH (DUF202 family)
VSGVVRTERLVWFGVLGGPLAWTLSLVLGVEVSDAACSTVGAPASLDAWALGIAVVGGLVAAAAEVAAIGVFRATRDSGHELPASRIHFLSVIGMVVGALFLVLILMSGLGSLALPECVQS